MKDLRFVFLDTKRVLPTVILINIFKYVYCSELRVLNRMIAKECRCVCDNPIYKRSRTIEFTHDVSTGYTFAASIYDERGPPECICTKCQDHREWVVSHFKVSLEYAATLLSSKTFFSILPYIPIRDKKLEGYFDQTEVYRFVGKSIEYQNLKETFPYNIIFHYAYFYSFMLHDRRKLVEEGYLEKILKRDRD